MFSDFWDFWPPTPLFLQNTTVCPQICCISWLLPPSSLRTSYIDAPLFCASLTFKCFISVGCDIWRLELDERPGVGVGQELPHLRDDRERDDCFERSHSVYNQERRIDIFVVMELGKFYKLNIFHIEEYSKYKRGASLELRALLATHWSLDHLVHCGHQMASEVKSDLWFEICDLSYPHIHVHVILLIPVYRSPRPLQPPNNLRGQIWPRIWNQWPKKPMWPKLQGTFVY